MKLTASWSVRLAGMLLFCGLIWVAPGCGSSSTQIRFVHAADGTGGVDVLIDTRNVATNVVFANASAYIKTSSGQHTLEIRPTGTSSDLVNTQVTLAGGSSTTGMFENVGGAPAFTPYTDDLSTPPNGQVRLRIIHAAEGAGNLDIYIVSPGTQIFGLSPTLTNLTYAGPAQFKVLQAAGYEVIATQAGTQNIVIDTGSGSPINMTNQQVKTFIAFDNLGNTPYLVLSDLN